jgi:hypothetical protein
MRRPPKERRRRYVYTTQNTEYHVYDGVCVAVRDLNSAAWKSRHRALNKRIDAAVRVYPNGSVVPQIRMPQVGEGMLFVLDRDCDNQLVTSPITAIARPAFDDLHMYPAA